MIKRVNNKETVLEREQRIADKWAAEDTFFLSIKNRLHKDHFVIYEGPPTANGEPHIGHVFVRVIKDIVGRYKTMCGHYVFRKAGWDTHGLPVELGVEKAKKLDGKNAILAYGMDRFIQACEESVFTYQKIWHRLTEEMGYWIDLKKPYITLDPAYIESVWHILSHIHQKGLLNKGHRVSPYCSRCQTTLSSHEVAQGYEMVKDTSVIVEFPQSNNKDIVFLAWTTTPWTLPANVALVVHPKLTYLAVQRKNLPGKTYILAQDCMKDIFNEEEVIIVDKYQGEALKGISYQPPFRYNQEQIAYKVFTADFVNANQGTGIVHTAPAHGEEDEKVARKYGLNVLKVIDSKGCYTNEVADFANKFVKDCEKELIKKLKTKKILFKTEKYEHSYPFCWRCKTPLIYMAMTSWFIKTTAIQKEIQEANEAINWLPENIKKGRMGNFLADLVDWNISRNRFWGTPLNVWECTSCEETFVPDDFKVLASRIQGSLPPDFNPHKPYIDDLTIKCKSCHHMMKRTPEVIDVWFDSGSMPFAQYGLPFDTDHQYPADFICEGIDQTRGWFFSMLVIAKLLGKEMPYKTALATGLILDENGKKMSKSQGNVVDPLKIIAKYGADALRWYLCASGSPWQAKKFSDKGVAEAKSKIIDTFSNAHAFFALYAELDEFVPSKKPEKPDNWLDRWLISRLHQTAKTTHEELEKYDFLRATRNLSQLIDDISNWYIRRSRQRFWCKGMTTDKKEAFQTLHETLVTLSKLIAPFLPFVADDIHQNLMKGKSVHLTDYPQGDSKYINPALEKEMQDLRTLVELGRQARNNAGINTRQPLETLFVDGTNLNEEAKTLLKEELNVQNIKFSSLKSFEKISLKLNLPVAGPVFGKQTSALREYLENLSSDEAKKLIECKNKQITYKNQSYELKEDHYLIEIKGISGYAIAKKENLGIALTTTITEELKKQGWLRHIVRQVQNLRKEQNLPLESYIELTLATEEAELYKTLNLNKDVLIKGILLKKLNIINNISTFKDKKSYTVDNQIYFMEINT